MPASMNVLCRGCRTELDINASNCPICLRPRDRSEMLEDSKRIRAEHAAAKKRPWIILGWVLGLAAAGYAGWIWRQPVTDAVARVRGKASSVLETASDPRTYAPAVPGTPGAATPTPASAPQQPSRHSGAPSAPGAPPAPSAPTAAPEEAKPDWTLPPPSTSNSGTAVIVRGFVYDLVTARPLPGVRFNFQDRLSGARIAVVSDHRGYYETFVSLENSGLTPVSDAPGYRREPIEDDVPPWHDRSPARRKAAAAKPPTDILLTFTSRQEEAVFNIVLVPTR